TGQLYSPAIYQRLLSAYAPERRPSTATLAAEKLALAGDKAFRAPVSDDLGEPPSPPAFDAGRLHALVSDAVDAALVRATRFGANSAGQLDFYAARLRETEQTLLTVRAEAARLAAELAVAQHVAAASEKATELAQGALEQQAAAVTRLSAEVADIRKFALQSIDESRGETRIWKERAVALEAQRQLDARLMETFRQQAYRAGGAIPDVLRQDKSR
ncbi:MAG: hypothetical protein ACREWI_12235, partial [Telluria sp.]